MARLARPAAQQGSTAVEFAIVAPLLVLLLLGITGFAQWIYTLEMLADATRSAARMAVVCDMNASAIRASIQNKVPQIGLQSAQIQLDYAPAGCNQSNCQAVTVSLTGATFAPWFPAGDSSFPIPAFTTSLPRESLESVNAAGDVNPACS